MPTYNADTLDLHLCRKCLSNEAAHAPREAYYKEYELEGKRSSSYALETYGCNGYEHSGLTFTEVMRLKQCWRRWDAARQERDNG